MSAASSNHNIAPNGCLGLRLAIASIRRRMFTSGIPAGLIDAARANLAEAADLTHGKIPRTPVRPRMPAYPEPIEFIADALRSGHLKLFIYTENRQHLIPVPGIGAVEVLERAGFFRPARETIAFRFMDFLPRRILDSLDLKGINKAQFDEFALCLRESAFDIWLASTARQQSWPLDAKPRRGRGRPQLGPIIKPILKDLIDGGRWRQGMLLKELVVPIQSKVEGEKVDRETVKKAMHDLYRETGQLEYRYVRRKRRASTKRRDQ
jgi:hypothetical protein